MRHAARLFNLSVSEFLHLKPCLVNQSVVRAMLPLKSRDHDILETVVLASLAAKVRVVA
jgi:hypothetical protein